MTTTTETVPVIARPTRRVPRFRAVAVAFLLGVTAAVGAGGAGLYAYASSHVDRIFPGVHVGTVDLSNLDRATASSRLTEAFGSYGNGTVVLSSGVVRDSLTYASLGRRLDIDAILDEAFAVGRTGNAAQRAVDLVRTGLNGTTIQPLVTVDPDAVTQQIDNLAARVDRDPVDATVVKTDRFTTTPAVNGRSLDRIALAGSIVDALQSSTASDHVSLDLPFTTVGPHVSDGDANLIRASVAAMAHSVKIVAGSDSWTINDATVRKWISIGWRADGTYGPSVDSKQITTALKPIAAAIKRNVRDANFLISKTGHIVGVTAAAAGRKLDVAKMTAAIRDTVLGRAASLPGSNDAIQASLIEVQPSLSTAQAQKSAPLMRKISSWTTYYVSGAHNGFSANISIPAKAIDGTVVAPGQWFSFWKTVGAVTLAKGYKLGGAIVDGHSVEGHTIGGGICSTSTTIFNAALRAGFQMGARKNHYYYIARYPKGLDATVYISNGGGAQDMTWRNDTPYPVLIRAFAVPGIVRFTLYSIPTGRHVSFTAPTVRNYLPSTTVVRYTTALRPGVSEQVEYEAAGFDAWVTRTVTDRSGRVVHRDTYYSHYARMVGLILIGKS
jgi:vancomycin resistance protein YoaR